MYTNTATTYLALFFAATSSATALPSPFSHGFESRDHLVCTNGICGVQVTCANNFNVAAGSDPRTPGNMPDDRTPWLVTGRNNTVASARRRIKRAVSPSLSPLLPRFFTRSTSSSSTHPHQYSPRQSVTRWCALGTSLYLTPGASSNSVNSKPPKQKDMLALLVNANDTIQSRLNLAPDRAIKGDTTAIKGYTSPSTSLSGSGSSGDTSLFSLSGSSMIFELDPGTVDGISWGMLGNATSALWGYVNQQKSSDVRAMSVGITVGTKVFGTILLG